MKRGSALIMALWIIAVLSVMAMSFAFEAHQSAGINVYVRERNRVNRLVEPGRILGETVMLGFSEAKEWSEDEDEKDLDEEDRWYREKRALKFDTRCTIGPILLDEDDEDSGFDIMSLLSMEAERLSEVSPIEMMETYEETVIKVTLEELIKYTSSHPV